MKITDLLEEIWLDNVMVSTEFVRSNLTKRWTEVTMWATSDISFNSNLIPILIVVPRDKLIKAQEKLDNK